MVKKINTSLMNAGHLRPIQDRNPNAGKTDDRP